MDNNIGPAASSTGTNNAPLPAAPLPAAEPAGTDDAPDSGAETGMGLGPNAETTTANADSGKDDNSNDNDKEDRVTPGPDATEVSADSESILDERPPFERMDGTTNVMATGADSEKPAPSDGDAVRELDFSSITNKVTNEHLMGKVDQNVILGAVIEDMGQADDAVLPDIFKNFSGAYKMNDAPYALKYKGMTRANLEKFITESKLHLGHAATLGSLFHSKDIVKTPVPLTRPDNTIDKGVTPNNVLYVPYMTIWNAIILRMTNIMKSIIAVGPESWMASLPPDVQSGKSEKALGGDSPNVLQEFHNALFQLVDVSSATNRKCYKPQHHGLVFAEICIMKLINLRENGNDEKSTLTITCDKDQVKDVQRLIKEYQLDGVVSVNTHNEQGNDTESEEFTEMFPQFPKIDMGPIEKRVIGLIGTTIVKVNVKNGVLDMTLEKDFKSKSEKEVNAQNAQSIQSQLADPEEASENA